MDYIFKTSKVECLLWRKFKKFREPQVFLLKLTEIEPQAITDPDLEFSSDDQKILPKRNTEADRYFEIPDQRHISSQ